MWDTVDDRSEPSSGPSSGHLSHDLPCPWCGHAGHYYLPCDAACGCRGHVMPGAAGNGREVAVAS